MLKDKFPIYLGKSKINGKGSFASRNIKKDEIINIFGGQILSEKEVDGLIENGKMRMDDDFQIDDDKFLVGMGDDYYTNHSCDPNAGVKNINQIVAIRDIKKDEEITIDYSTTSGVPKKESAYKNDRWSMNCDCGSGNCRKRVGFILSLPKETLDRYIALGIIPDFILKSLKN